jgi:hypothetical protein
MPLLCRESAHAATMMAVNSYRIALYRVFLALPSSCYQSSAVALLKMMAADVVEGPLSSLVRADLHAADFVLESLAYATDSRLFESGMAPDGSVHALRSAELEARLFLPSSVAISVVDKVECRSFSCLPA